MRTEQEEVWQVLEGELEVTVGRVTGRGPGCVAIVTDYPRRE